MAATDTGIGRILSVAAPHEVLTHYGTREQRDAAIGRRLHA